MYWASRSRPPWLRHWNAWKSPCSAVRMYFACSIWLICTLSKPACLKNSCWAWAMTSAVASCVVDRLMLSGPGWSALYDFDELLRLGHVLLQRVARVGASSRPGSGRTDRSRPC